MIKRKVLFDRCPKEIPDIPELLAVKCKITLLGLEETPKYLQRKVVGEAEMNHLGFGIQAQV